MRFAVEDVPAPGRQAGQGVGQPEPVVLPHLVVWDGVQVRPQRRGFLRFPDLALVPGGDEGVDVDGVAVDELEQVLAPVLEAEGRDAEFLLDFADRAVEWLLAGLETAAGAVDLAGAQASLLADQEDAFPIEDEGQSRLVDGAPTIATRCRRPSSCPRPRAPPGS